MLSEHIAIVGSRGFRRQDLVQDFVDQLPAGSVVVSGGARGVDQFAEEAAKARGLETLIFLADWKRYGRRAGPVRNEEIIANCDRVVAFWDGSSRGTLNAIVLAHRAELPIEIIDADGQAVSLEAALEVAQELGVIAAIVKAKIRRT